MNPNNKITVIIPAAGESSRFGGSIPKQFLSLGDETVLEKSVNLFLEISYIREVIVAINLNEHLVKSLHHKLQLHCLPHRPRSLRLLESQVQRLNRFGFGQRFGYLQLI